MKKTAEVLHQAVVNNKLPVYFIPEVDLFNDATPKKVHILCSFVEKSRPPNLQSKYYIFTF